MDISKSGVIIQMNSPKLMRQMIDLLIDPDPHSTTDQSSAIKEMMDLYGYPDEKVAIIEKEKQLPLGLLKRLHSGYTLHSGIWNPSAFLRQA